MASYTNDIVSVERALPTLVSHPIHYEYVRVCCILTPDVLLVVWRAAQIILSCVFSAIYWPASVSNWCDSCSLLGERRHDIPSPRFISGPGGHYRPLLHEVFTTSMFECVAYYRQMSSWFVWQTARTILSDSSHRSFASLLMLIPALLASYWPRVVMSWVYLQGELGRSATGHGGMLHAISLLIICALICG